MRTRRRVLPLCLWIAPTLIGCGHGIAADAGSDTPSSDVASATEGGSDVAAYLDAADAQSILDAGRDATDAADTISSDTGSSTAPILFVSGASGSIDTWHVNEITGAISMHASVNPGGNPSFLALAPNARFLYACAEATNQIVSFSIDPSTHAIVEINRVSSGAAGPAHVAVDHSGRWVAAADYGGGGIAVWPINADGSLGAQSDSAMPGTFPHEVVFDPSNRFLFVPCKGSDYVAQYLFDASTGHLTPNAVPRMMTAAGAGPRHLAFDPAGHYVYLIHELDSTMSVLSFDATTGTLTPRQTLSTRAPGATGTNTGAEVQVHPSGRFVYGSNRGDDDIVIYSVGAADGHLSMIGHQSTAGTRPRHFSLDAAGHWLYAANQMSNTVVAFSVDATTGLLTQHGSTPVPMGPSFAGVFSLLAP